MKRYMLLFFFLLPLFLFLNFVFPTDIEIKIKTKPSPPPKILIKPTLVVIPETKVMYVSNYEDFEIFYFDGFWFCYYDGYWWKTKELSKPWIKIEVKHVPKEIVMLPAGWRLKIKHRHTFEYKKENAKPKKGVKKLR